MKPPLQHQQHQYRTAATNLLQTPSAQASHDLARKLSELTTQVHTTIPIKSEKNASSLSSTFAKPNPSQMAPLQADKSKKTSLQQQPASVSQIMQAPKQKQSQYSSTSKISTAPYSNANVGNASAKLATSTRTAPPNLSIKKTVNDIKSSVDDGSSNNFDDSYLSIKSNKISSMAMKQHQNADLTNTNPYVPLTSSNPSAYTNYNPYNNTNTTAGFYTMGTQGHFYPNQINTQYNPYTMPPFQYQSGHQQQPPANYQYQNYY